MAIYVKICRMILLAKERKIWYKKVNKIASEDIEMHFIELPKFLKKKPDIENKLEQWLCLISEREEEVKMILEKNKEIKKANKEVEILSQDEQEREIYELRLKALRDEENIRLTGVAQGMTQGEKKKQIEIAKNMIKENIDKEVISKVTGLSIEKIESLIKN